MALPLQRNLMMSVVHRLLIDIVTACFYASDWWAYAQLLMAFTPGYEHNV